MSESDVEMVLSADDARGQQIIVYQDHNGVRIDSGGIEIMLTIDGAGRLADAITNAKIGARLWDLGMRS